MSVDLNALNPVFRDKVHELLEKCKAEGIIMRPNEGLRTPFQQAKYWRQSRSSEEVHNKIAELTLNGAPFLAECIESVGPQHGPHVTNSLPGLSWHQWGEALDCFWMVNGKAEWSATRLVNGQNGFKVYARIAAELGLNAGGLWKKLKDWPHVQLSLKSSPSDVYTLAEINSTMGKTFNHTEVN